ncbi:MAG TPA: hypothetical protein VGF17_30780, partial [Phytomonospora sp.]
MRFSKRPQPMDFGRADEDMHDEAESALVYEARHVGFRPLDSASEQPPALRPNRPTPVTAADEVEARAVAFTETPPPAWPIWLVAAAVALLWAAAPIAFAVGYRNQVAPLQYDPFALAVFAL